MVQELARASNVDVVSLRILFAKVPYEPEMHDAGRLLLTQYVLEATGAHLELVNGHVRRLRGPGRTIDSHDLVVPEQTSGKKPTEPGRDPDDQNLRQDASSVELKRPVRIILVPNLVHRLLPVVSGVQAVWTVEHHPLSLAHILVGVNHAFGDEHHEWVLLARLEAIMLLIGLGIFSVVPEIDAESGRTEKTEKVRLVHVLVWSASHAGVGHRDIAHDGVELLLQLILAKELRKPATGILVALGVLIVVLPQLLIAMVAACFMVAGLALASMGWRMRKMGGLGGIGGIRPPGGAFRPTDLP